MTRREGATLLQSRRRPRPRPRPTRDGGQGSLTASLVPVPLGCSLRSFFLCPAALAAETSFSKCLAPEMCEERGKMKALNPDSSRPGIILEPAETWLGLPPSPPRWL